MAKKYLPTITALLLLAACTPTPAPQTVTKPSFFPIKNYFAQEAARLSQTNQSFTKLVRIKDKSETQTFNSNGFDFKNAFDIFANSDINNPVWADRYQTDTLSHSPEKITYQYTAKDENLRTQKIIIEEYKNSPRKNIQIHNKTANLLREASQHLTYDSEQGFTMQNAQEALLLGKDNFYIEVRF